jgi:hypothetical protein
MSNPTNMQLNTYANQLISTQERSNLLKNLGLVTSGAFK